MYGVLSQAIGSVDLDCMKRLYRKSGSFPPGALKDIRERYSMPGA